MDIIRVAEHLQSRIMTASAKYIGTTEAELQTQLDDPAKTVWSGNDRLTAAQLIAGEAGSIAAVEANQLNAAKQSKLVAIEASYAKAAKGRIVPFDGEEWEATDSLLQGLNGASARGGNGKPLPAGFGLPTKTYKKHPLNPAQVKDLQELIGDDVYAIQDQRWNKLNAVVIATTTAEVDAVSLIFT